MKVFRVLVGVAAAALFTTPASAQALQSSSSAPTVTTFTIENDTPYSLFTETLGGGLQCIEGAIPATSIAPGASRSFRMAANMRGACGRLPSVGQQTFVIGGPGPEQRINAAFQISSDADRNMVANNLRSGPFLLSGGLQIAYTTVEAPPPGVGFIPVLTPKAVWRVSCAGAC